MKLWIHLCWLVCLGNAHLAGAAETVTYLLVPGSALTVYSNGVTIGPEPVTGSFDWVGCGEVNDSVCFDTTRLDFQSASFSIQLHAPNELVGGIAFINVPLFDEAVDAPGIVTGVAEMISVYREGTVSEYPEGVYSDRAWYPLSLEYPDLRIMPLGGGYYFAALEIKAVADRDRDGVPDDIDECPDTSAGAVVDQHGCSIDQLVPCAGPVSGGTWKNHAKYVGAVAETAKAFERAGMMTANEMRAVVRAAMGSDCGKK
jgi:hypothetical protein